MNELTEFTGRSEAIGRRYGAQGPFGGLVRTVATDLFPVVQSDGDACDPELNYLASEMLAAGSAFDAAPGAGVNAQVGLMNPNASDTIIVVQSIRVLNPTAAVAAYDLRITSGGVSAGPDATAGGVPRDTRWGPSAGARTTGLLFSLSSAATIGVLLETVRVNVTSQEFFHSVPIVLDPGGQLNVYSQTANINLQAVFRWRERRMTQWERRSG